METNANKALRRMMAVAALAVGMSVAASAHAGYSGPVTITGKRWVDGVEHKVKCSASEGNWMESGLFNERTLSIENGPNCGVWLDTDDADQLLFEGKEKKFVVNGVEPGSYVFSGVQTADGPNGNEPARGALSGILKCVGNNCAGDRGTITYSRKNSVGETIIFIGKYKANY